MNDNQKQIYDYIKIYYKAKDLPSHSDIMQTIIKFESLFNSKLNDNERLEILKMYEINIGIKAFSPDTIISKNENQEWFNNKKKILNNRPFWDRYVDFLRQKEDFGEEVIQNLEKSTEEILSYCANPNLKSGDVRKRKGLVVGDVQSGKTANYLALINMACDYDYKVFIILAGMTDSLRIQTQFRVDEGFVGALSETIGSGNITYIGVGNVNGINKRCAISLTNKNKDFKKESINTLNLTKEDFDKPIILVIKKNKSTLENVKTWLKPGQEFVKDHVLIIDDEADNASINTKKNGEDPTAINKLIRELYNKFTIASYVGYTATPFANVFINPNDDPSYKDLFPTDFITLLNSPSNYFGPEKVFGESNNGKTKFIREIDENEDNFLSVFHKKDEKIEKLSDSLTESILVYFINNVIRTIVDNIHCHRTMMINISRFNDMQSRIKQLVFDYVNNLKNIITQTSFQTKENFLRNKEMLRMYNLYMTSDYYDLYRKTIPWETIQANLGYETEKIKILVVNRKKDEEKLDYFGCKDVGARYIVIGGYVLSRGLTLEGLMVSYYSRNGSAYDSLLQMCRWFGYRPKYENLCRIYMSGINIDNFCAVIDSVNDLKQQFKEMKKKGKTPDNFGLMVKKHPDILNSLLVTSRNKSRLSIDKTLILNYSCQTIDTSKIYKDKEINIKNRININNILLSNLGEPKEIYNRYMYCNVNKEIIKSILNSFIYPIQNYKFDVDSICAFLEKTSTLNYWDIVFATGENNSNLKNTYVGTKSIINVQRSFNIRKDENIIRISGNNNRLIDPGLLNAGFSKSEIEKIKKEVGKCKNLISSDYLRFRKNPILLIYFITPIIRLRKDKKNDVLGEEFIRSLDNNCLVGLGIGFPLNGEKIEIEYKLNLRKKEELEKVMEDNIDDEDDEGESDYEF